MGNASSDVTCTDCGAARDADYDGPCRECGSKNRTVHLEATGVGTSFGSAKVTVTKVREFVERHPAWTAVAVGATLGGVAVTPLLGPAWGTAAAGAFALISLYASGRGETTVREREIRG